MEMNEALIYLQEALGLSAKTETWPGSARLPLHLRAIEVRAVDANGFSFLLASLPTGVGLPEAKRVYSQLALRAETPVVVSFPDADARQRKALVAQGIPFVCPGRQAFLPFMGTACTERGGARFRNHATKMSPNAQAAAIWGAAQEPYRPHDLCRALGISASRASEAITELVDRGLARRERRERRVVVFPVAVDLLLSEHMAELSSPVSKVFFARKTPQIDYLVDAGETALAARSMLAAPGMEQKAVLRSAWRQLSDLEVADGELPDNETAMIQVWRYAPCLPAPPVSTTFRLRYLWRQSTMSEFSSKSIACLERNIHGKKRCRGSPRISAAYARSCRIVCSYRRHGMRHFARGGGAFIQGDSRF